MYPLEPRLHLQNTPFGHVAMVWSLVGGLPRIRRLFLSGPAATAEKLVRKDFPAAVVSSCTRIDRTAGRICAFLEGEDVSFDMEMISLRACSRFQREVLRAESEVPRGRVTTYARIARRVGSPGGARAVGAALAGNPFPIIIPCHRAVRSDGAIGGFQGGPHMKRALLKAEGVRFDAAGRVLDGRFFY